MTANDDNTRPLEAGVRRDFSRSLSYGDYLRAGPAAAAPSTPCSVPPHHDELLFIIQHQTTELWLKLVLHELRSARDLLRADDLAPALKRLARVKHIQRTLTEQWSVLATLTPTEYAEFRGVPRPRSSGFQSWQYRAVEFMLGNKNADMLRGLRPRPRGAGACCARLLEAPSVYDEFLRYLHRRGLPVPAELLDRDCHQGAHVQRPSWCRSSPHIYEHAHEHWDAVRDVRGARRPRGQLPALALPPPQDGRAHHRLQARHRRLQRRRLPAPRARPHLLPRAVRRAHRDRCTVP